MTGIRLRDIRPHEGSQARAWEELAYQLRPTPGAGHVETRKTRAPDGGVEWYDLYEDGHQEGFQAKFNAKLEDALGGMLESVKAVAAKRPEMTRLTFVVPYDFTDAASKTSKSDQNRWDDAVQRWKTDVEGASQLDFKIVRAGDIVEALSQSQHTGRRAYWFGDLELTDEWLLRRWTEAKEVAGERYTPQADIESGLQNSLDAACAGRAFVCHVEALITDTLVACRHNHGMWRDDLQVVNDYLARLEAARDRSLKHGGEAGVDLATFEIDFNLIASAAERIGTIARAHLRGLKSYERRGLDQALSAAAALTQLAGGQLAELYKARILAIEGPAGQGKTHSLMHAAQLLLDRHVPAIVILGQRVKDDNWWPAFASTLGGLPGTSDEFLQAFDSLAEARACRGTIFVDALNEAQNPRTWRTELPTLIEQLRKYQNIALIVSYRTDYRDVIQPPTDLPTVNHPGLAGHEEEALVAYCSLFGISVPAHASLDPVFGNALFLRMYCAVVAGGLDTKSDQPTRTSLFSRFAGLQSKRVRDSLHLPPTSEAVTEALRVMADHLLANQGRAVRQSVVEPIIDGLLPGRDWPDTLFHRLVSEGLLEVRPGFDKVDSIAFPFQAYSEHFLAIRLLEVIEQRRPPWILRLIRRQNRHFQRILAKELRHSQWLWRAMSVLLPEARNLELIDLLPDQSTDYRMIEATRESLTERTADSFSQRAMQLLNGDLDFGPHAWIDVVLSLAPRAAHPANSDWLHRRLITVAMADRDASWSIDSFQVDDYSPAFTRLASWADRGAPTATTEQARLVALAMMWLLTSPNRFLRDRVSKSVVALLEAHLDVAKPLIESAQDVDDTYVQERVLTCIYGALMVGGDADLTTSAQVTEALAIWANRGLPINVLARDSARGSVGWAHSRGLGSSDLPERFSPPYGAGAPVEPPTADELRERYGPVRDNNGNIIDWRAAAILSSCLDWMGDFNKYVVKSDVGFFSRYPLSGPAPTAKHGDDNGEIDADWAGRWIANRAIELGWTVARFQAFESDHDLRRGREGHKAERFGKKYQWIALHELLARLADNFHPAHESWNPDPMVYQGPWSWYGRDFDPSLPPSVRRGASNICRIEWTDRDVWARLQSPALDASIPAHEWVADIHDFPTTTSMFEPIDEDGHQWIAIQRYSTWDRNNAKRSGITQRERDVFFLQFSWLTPQGQGARLYDLIVERGLSGRWMPDRYRTHTQYLGEQDWAPIIFTESQRQHDVPPELRESALAARPAVEGYLWEGNVRDCSLDESVDFYTPTAELLGDARWIGHTSYWRYANTVVSKALRVEDGENGQDVLLVDPDWLNSRLRALGAEMIIGTLSEKHALLDDDDRKMAFSDVWYVAHLAPDSPIRSTGPFISVRGNDRDGT